MLLRLLRKLKLLRREVVTTAQALLAVEHIVSQYKGAEPTSQVREALLRDLDHALWACYRERYPGYSPLDLYWVDVFHREDHLQVDVWLRGFPGGRARRWSYRV